MSERTDPEVPVAQQTAPLGEVVRSALWLGLTSFGGPVAHLGYFRHEYVERRRWLDAHEYADLVALCQFLPGPASSQLGIAIGTLRAGALGGIVAWLCFTAPSAVALVLFAQLAARIDLATAGWIDGLKLAAVAVVAQAVFTMWRTLAPDLRRSALAVAAAAIALLWPSPFIQVALIGGGGLLGWRFLHHTRLASAADGARSPISRRTGIALLIVFAALLLGLPIARLAVPDQGLALVDSFYRAGALVFGGGHVVLPLLRESVVPTGWVSDDSFLAGYGAAQAVPGPLFTFAAYLGAVMRPAPNGPLGAALALGAIFLPSFLLIWGALPFWHQLRANEAFRRALLGTNATVVGILLAALYDPIWVSAVHSGASALVAVVVFGLLVARRTPPWAAVVLCAVAGEVLRRA